jgi:O-antigen/teichoic acid export membrane protein
VSAVKVGETPLESPTYGVRLAGALGVRDAGRVLRDFLTYLPSQALPALAGFLVLPLLARRLSPTDLGVLALAQTTVTLGWTLSGSWLGAAVVRELPAHRRAGTIAAFRATLTRGLQLTALLLAGFALLLGAISLFSSAIGHNLGVIIAATAATLVQNLAVSLLAAGLRTRAYALILIPARVGGIALGMYLVFEGHGVTGYLAGLAIVAGVVGAVGLAIAWPRGGGSAPDHSESPLRRWVDYGVATSMAAMAVWALSFLDRYLLAFLDSAGAVGVYAVGNALGDRLMAIPLIAFSTAATPLMITAFEREGRSETERLLRSYTRIIVLVTIPLVGLIAATSPTLVPLLTGGSEEYDPAVVIAPIVAVGSILLGLAAFASVGLSLARKMRPLIYASLVGVAANVAVNVALIPPFGVYGAAVAMPIGMTSYLVSVYLWARPYARWRFPAATGIRAVAATTIAFVAVGLLTRGVDSDVGRILIVAFAGLLAYGLLLLVFGERRSAAR